METTVVHELARKKYACATCKESVVTAPWRGKVIDKGMLGPGFLSHVIVERFGNHLPYFRLEGKYRSEGLDLSRSVLCTSMARCADLLEPIADQVREEIVASAIVNTDDTPVTVAQSSSGGSRQARVWAYKEAIDRIRVLFKVDDAAAELSDEDRARFRQEHAGPLLEELRAWLHLTRTQVLPKSPMGQAITYMQNQWVALTEYLKDGRLEMTNNAAERAVKPFAIGRRNWLFFQREGGGKTASVLMTLLMTGKAAGVHLGDYFKDVLLRISEPGVDVKSLTPHGWKERFEAEVTARRHEILRKLVGPE